VCPLDLFRSGKPKEIGARHHPAALASVNRPGRNLPPFTAGGKPVARNVANDGAISWMPPKSWSSTSTRPVGAWMPTGCPTRPRRSRTRRPACTRGAGRTQPGTCGEWGQLTEAVHLLAADRPTSARGEEPPKVGRDRPELGLEGSLLRFRGRPGVKVCGPDAGPPCSPHGVDLTVILSANSSGPYGERNSDPPEPPT
jgi:hypothetical protein